MARVGAAVLRPWPEYDAVIWWIAGGLIWLGLGFAVWCVVRAGALADQRTENFPGDNEENDHE